MMEYQYIKDQHISSGRIKVRDSNVHREVQDYNERMDRNRRKKLLWLEAFWGMLGANVLILFSADVCIFNDKPLMCGILTVAFVAIFGYFVGFRKIFHPVFGCLVTGILLPLHAAFLFPMLMNGVFCYMLKKLDFLKTEPGYPNFYPLQPDYMDADTSDDTV